MKHTVPRRIPNICPLFLAILCAAILVPISRAASDATAKLSPDVLAGGGHADNAKALEHLREASGDFPKAQLIEAYVMLRLNRPDQARRTLQSYLMRTPAR